MKVLLFDFDGTIADTADVAVKLYNEIAQEQGYTVISKNNLATLRNMSAREVVTYMGVPMLKIPFIAARVRAALKDEVPNLKIIEGIREPLQLLKSKGYKMYIVSSNAKEHIERFLQNNQIMQFDGVYSVSNLFGKHVKIKSLVRTNHWDPLSVFYIGDEARDIEAAKKAQVVPISVAWGYNTEEVLAKNTPRMLLHNPSELAQL
jgi:phosphoglycolate phosphatase-like HAD superfamily hydrolase